MRLTTGAPKGHLTVVAIKGCLSSELWDVKGSCDSPALSSQWKQRTSALVMSSNKRAVTSPRPSSLLRLCMHALLKLLSLHHRDAV
jgi:hypothetical protein